MEQLVKKIIARKKTCVFVSPHFDDAVLSAGALLSSLGQQTAVTVINVFTSALSEPTTLSARAYLKQCGYPDAKTLYVDRTREDAAVLGPYTREIINLGFVDALWRKRQPTIWSETVGKVIPEFKTIYPTYKFHITKGTIADADSETVQAITKRLRHIIDPKKSIVFCPLAIGNHVDHVLVKTICQKNFPEVIFWSDFPYNERADISVTKGLQPFTFGEQLDQKRALIEGYTTQFQAMFAGGLAIRPETFYTNGDFLGQ